jgi:catechol 2,3-dioxygenase-like lactoylglutathione lyase family enzyme
MPDVGFTHVALPASDLKASVAFYEKYARLHVVHRRRQSDGELEVAWLSDLARPFVLVLVEFPQVETPLGPFAHLGVACASREEVDRLCALARSDGCLREPPTDSGDPVGYYAMLSDPDGHTLELSFGQETGLTVAHAAQRAD